MKRIFSSTVVTLLIQQSLSAQQTRTEKDLLGEKQIDAKAYYGVQTARALENFTISGVPTSFYPDYVKAFAMVKLAAARANTQVGNMKPEKLAAIEKACQAVIDGKYRDQFLVDMYQGGAGTSANMNVNEVLANIALELSGKQKGDYHSIEPHDDLNMGQSTNDSYPTAIKIALLLHNDKLVSEADALAKSFHKKGDEFKGMVKMGRTEGQDAVPMTLGQEFHAFGNQLDAEIAALRKSETYLCEQNMGATAIGTGITATPGYADKVAAELAKITGKPIVKSSDLIAATSSQQAFVIYSAALKSFAIALSKISSDLIFLASGPRTGIFEINLPALQPGSSIMPGKVNPVMPEVMNEVCFKVMGNDVTVSVAAHSGLLQLNAYEPVEAVAIMESQGLLFKTLPLFRKNCIDGITANKNILDKYITQSVGIVTALNPVLGYEKTTELAKEALKSGKGILELIREKKLLTEDQIKKLLDPVTLTGEGQ
ncbi:aspartate ammonia-lyase [Niastella koreensis]|uniref:Aspartate ammonia-lyase n=2 Tax=Niastella koreensis TaxID=354356 RepID=G8TGN7_NIAKG|nr:aspartate ammonia-lyase [Niastella koreensis]AEV98479.1 Aspartate ammonia-lyase [Niastella koreensis GR20-10]OQP53075.1 aspartate ammonia-lyase [Niastella koreensis]